MPQPSLRRLRTKSRPARLTAMTCGRPTLMAGRAARAAVGASAPEAEQLTFGLADAPAGMMIDARGRISWATSASVAGSHHVEVRVTDPRGLSAAQAVDLTVRPDTQAPRVQL